MKKSNKNTSEGYLGGSVDCLTLDFGSGHDLVVMRLSPISGSVLTRFSLSPILSVPPRLVVSLSLSLRVNK